MHSEMHHLKPWTSSKSIITKLKSLSFNIADMEFVQMALTLSFFIVETLFYLKYLACWQRDEACDNMNPFLVSMATNESLQASTSQRWRHFSPSLMRNVNWENGELFFDKRKFNNISGQLLKCSKYFIFYHCFVWAVFNRFYAWMFEHKIMHFINVTTNHLTSLFTNPPASRFMAIPLVCLV